MILKKVFLLFFMLLDVSKMIVSASRTVDPIFDLLTRDKIAELIEYLQNNPDSVVVQDLDGMTPLLHAVKYKNFSAVGELLRQGALPNKQDQFGVTPLMHAISGSKNIKSDDDIVDLLISVGHANVNARDTFKRTALHRAVEADKDFVVLQLLDKGANVNAQDITGKTPLMYALSKPDNLKIVDLLMAQTPKLGLSNMWNENLLHYATANPGYEDLVRYFLESGLDPLQQDDEGGIPNFSDTYKSIFNDWQKSLQVLASVEQIVHKLGPIDPEVEFILRKRNDHAHGKSTVAIGKTFPNELLQRPKINTTEKRM